MGLFEKRITTGLNTQVAKRRIADRNFNAARKTKNNSVRMEDAVDVDLKVKEEDTNYGFDERLMRRCKRRRIADRNFNAARKTRNNSVIFEKIEMQRTMKHFLRRESMETPETLRDITRKESKNLMMDVKEKNENHSPSGTNGHLRKRSGTASAEVLHPAKRECSREVESDMIDECDQKFLNCLENDGGNIVFMPENDIPMIYEGDVESSDDTEIIAMDKDPFRDGICSPFVASKINSFVCISLFLPAATVACFLYFWNGLFDIVCF